MADRMAKKKKIMNRPPDLLPVGTHTKYNKPNTSYVKHYPGTYNGKPVKNNIPDHLVASGVLFDKPVRTRMAQAKNPKNWLPTKHHTTDDIRRFRPFKVSKETETRHIYTEKHHKYRDRRMYTPDNLRFTNPDRFSPFTTNKDLHDPKSINFKREKEIFRINRHNDINSNNLHNDGTRPLDTEYKMEYTRIQKVKKDRQARVQG